MNIYKYQLENSHNTIEMPIGAKVLTMQLQNGIPCIWALVDQKLTYEKRKFEVIPTGPYFYDNYPLTYIGTFQNGDFVGHVFEITNK